MPFKNIKFSKWNVNIISSFLDKFDSIIKYSNNFFFFKFKEKFTLKNMHYVLFLHVTMTMATMVVFIAAKLKCNQHAKFASFSAWAAQNKKKIRYRPS